MVKRNVREGTDGSVDFCSIEENTILIRTKPFRQTAFGLSQHPHIFSRTSDRSEEGYSECGLYPLGKVGGLNQAMSETTREG